MNLALSRIEVKPSELAHRQIADQLRELIVTGKMRPGTKLPPTSELSRHWGAHIQNVQTAMATLTKEGLLDRMPRKGTFVRARTARLTCVGLYVTKGLHLDPISQYSHEVIAALDARLSRLEIKHDVWIDPRPDTELGQEWTDFTAAIRRQEMQGVIVISTSLATRRWLDHLRCPVAYLGDDLPTSVGNNTRQFWELSLGRLKEQGCRTVGLIAAIHPACVQIFDEFMDVCSELGLRFKSEWVRTPVNGPPTTRAIEPFGYDAFLSIWRQAERPDGLIVQMDTMARGAIMAMLVERVRVPEDLKVVLHRNAEIPLMCPFPVTFVELVCGEVAEALLQQVQRQFRGEPCKMICLPYRLAYQ